MEVNPIAVVTALLEITKSTFSNCRDATPTERDQLVARKLLYSLHEILTDCSFLEHDELQETPESQSSATSLSSQGSVYDDEGREITPDSKSIVPVAKKEEILKIIEMHPNWSLKTIQARGGKELKRMEYVPRWKSQIESGGTVFEKWCSIDRITYEKFLEARSEHKCVKESNIRMWAIQASQTFRDDKFNFTACHTWVSEFKKRHHISSRKVTKLVTKREMRSMDDIMNEARKFQMLIKSITPVYRQDLVMNSDQVGFAYELVSNRTLTHKGERMVYGLSKSPKNLATHSYTIQYMITLAGSIVGDVFLCFQEKTGRLGPQVVEKLRLVPNVTFTCSTSGKLTTSLFEYYLDEIVVKNVKEDFLYILDSWGGQIKASSYTERFGCDKGPECNLKIIPKKCTSICQPLDTTFNRQLKYFARAMYSEAMLHYSEDLNPVDEITTRNNIMRTHSLIHNQLSAPVFVPMIKYAWYSSGLTDERSSFLSVKEACFTYDGKDSATCTKCEKHRFIKCAYCRKNFCFPCFYYDFHYHIDSENVM